MALLVLTCFSAQKAEGASLIFGTISISGSYIPVNVANCGTQASCQTTGMTTLGAATGLDFITTNGITSPGVAGNYRVGGTTGDFTTAGIVSGNNGEMGTIKDISLVGSVNGFLTTPILLFQLNNSGNFSFDLLTMTFTQTLNQLDILGTGVLHLAGYLDTPGSFYFSNQGTGIGSFTFSATDSSLAAVPEPASLVLLGLGLVGIAAFGRRHRHVA